MSAQDQTFVIVGASLAGAKAAETLREEGFDGRVVLIGAEPERPYERPPLTKDYLRSESPREKAYVHPESFYGEHDIELITGTAVTALDPGRSRVTLSDGRQLGYDRLLLATVRSRAGCPSPAPGWTASTTCARLRIVTCCASAWRWVARWS
jgi:3-phenylpropionate/trans-cinnamate dioxygenase ferredoxin reductase subunit